MDSSQHVDLNDPHNSRTAGGAEERIGCHGAQDEGASEPPRRRSPLMVDAIAKPCGQSKSGSASAVEGNWGRVIATQQADLQLLRGALAGVEAERDFFVQKLRNIEILCDMLQAQRPKHLSTDDLLKDVQKILFAEDIGEEALNDKQGQEILIHQRRQVSLSRN